MMDRKELSFMIKNMRENSGVSKYGLLHGT